MEDLCFVIIQKQAKKYKMKKTTKSIQNFANQKVNREEKIKGGTDTKRGFGVVGVSTD